KAGVNGKSERPGRNQIHQHEKKKKKHSIVTHSTHTQTIKWRSCACFYYCCSIYTQIDFEFEDHRDADDAVYELNGKELCSERYGPPVRTEHRIIVENLSSRVSWQDLKDFIQKAGEVTYVEAAHRTNRN
uniref:Uncharacterized protein n=1 Tax=Leptobrachium leishanense TaxID=445787 RepID=A0A8C5QIZ5_9ANUR